MQRLRYALMIVLLCGGVAHAADLELQLKGKPGQAAPAEPSRLQSTEPPVPSDKDKPARTDDNRLNDLQMPKADVPAPDESWWQKIVKNAPGCRAFSDGCRTCNPGYACSGLPIACQPKEFVCIDPKP